jgi:sec-independent protein translocase protein TatC
VRVFGRQLPSLRLRKGRPPKTADGTMPLMEHLHELRRRLFIATLGIGLGTVVGFIWFGHGIPAIGLPSLSDILTGPYCAVPIDRRYDFGSPDECKLLATGPFSALELQLKSALIAGVVLAVPVWLYQLWAFVTPALYSKERKYAIIFVSAGGALFIGGAVLAYVVIREGLTVLLGFGGDATITALSPDSYFSFLIAMIMIFGVSFELPLLLIMLNRIGVVKGAKLAAWRRYAIFGLTVFAGLVVPGNDPITMLALAVSLALLYELSVQVAKLHDRGKLRQAAAVELSDDEATPLADLPTGPVAASADTTVQPVAPATPVAPPRPVPSGAASARPARRGYEDLGDVT